MTYGQFSFYFFVGGDTNTLPQISDALLKLENVPKSATKYAGFIADIGML